MPHLAELGAIEVIGTAGNDALSGRDQAVIFGRQGQDALTSDGNLSSDQWFFGGSGSDRYVVQPGTSVFVGDGFGSSGDVLRARGIGFEQPYTVFAEVEGRHLLILDFESLTNVMILDWLRPERAIERLELADGSLTLSAAAIRSLDNYAGNFPLEEIFAGAPPELADLFRAFVREGFERAEEVERMPQPALVQIIGTPADDELVGDARPEIISGAAGSDRIFGNAGGDQLHGGNGVDFIEGGRGADLLDGGREGDVLRGGSGPDQLHGRTGTDHLFGDDGADVLVGGEDDDELFGGGQADLLDGGRGNDVLNGGVGEDELNGGFGNDRLDGADGDDVLSGGPDRDELLGREGADTLNGNAGIDQLDGGADDDLLRGGVSGDSLLGDLGDDVMLGGGGADFLDGGSGRDRLHGGPGTDTLFGDIGADILDGQDGDDHLEGGRGSDVLTGGDGSDRFLFRSEATVDHVTDFSEADVLELFSQAWAIEGAPTGEDLDDFLQFVFDGTDTTLNVDVDGASEFGSPEIQVALFGVDLVGAASSQAEVIDGLLGGNQLELV